MTDSGKSLYHRLSKKEKYQHLLAQNAEHLEIVQLDGR